MSDNQVIALMAAILCATADGRSKETAVSAARSILEQVRREDNERRRDAS
jgi:hypothetical protein